MSSQQYRFERLIEKRAQGKRAIVKVNGVPWEFVGVQWGGTSPSVCLRDPAGDTLCMTAARWKAAGAKI